VVCGCGGCEGAGLGVSVVVRGVEGDACSGGEGWGSEAGVGVGGDGSEDGCGWLPSVDGEVDGSVVAGVAGGWGAVEVVGAGG